MELDQEARDAVRELVKETLAEVVNVSELRAEHDRTRATIREVVSQELVSALDARGAPRGVWIYDIEQVRGALRDAEDLLRRMEAAVIRAAEPDPFKTLDVEEPSPRP